MFGWDVVKAWAEGEKNLGIRNSLFVMDNGVVTQYVDVEEGEKFYNDLKKNLTEEYFNKIVEKFFKAIKDKDEVKIWECSAIFDEIDNYPEIANDDILMRLERVRKSTHEIIYK